MLKTAASLAFLIVALPAAAQSVSGTVTKVDEAQGKLTINHGPIKNLDMDAMTMVFRAADAAMLKGLKVGTKIKFDAEHENGQYIVTRIEKAH